MDRLDRVTRSALWPALAGIFGLAATLYLFYPGFMPWDSTAQFEQVLTGQIDNAHPTIMVYLWKLTNRVLYGPGGMFALQAATYWAGLVLIACSIARTTSVRVALILCLGFFPPVLGVLATVWKDSGSLAALVLVSGLMLHAVLQKRAAAALLAVPFAFYAFAVRFNGGLTVLPLLWRLSDALVPLEQRSLGGRRPALVRGGLFLALLAALSSLTYVVNNVGVRRYAYFAAVPLWDLAQISIATDELLVPKAAITVPDLQLPRLKEMTRNYRCDYKWRMLPDGRFAQDINWLQLSAADAREIVLRWLAAIRDHPRAYLSHRLRLAQAALFDPSFGVEPRVPVAADRIFLHAMVSTFTLRLPFRFTERPGYAIVKRIFAMSAESVLCRPWLYVVIALAVWIGAWSVRTEEGTLARAVVSSGLLSVVPLFVIAPSPDFRYSVWLIAAALIGGLVLLSGALRERPGARAPRSARRRTERLEGKRSAGNRPPS